MSGNGWCTHPDRQVSSDVRILVRKAELACRNAWGSDLWVDANADETSSPRTPQPSQPDQILPIVTSSYDDEVTSVVNSDQPGASRPSLDDEVVDQSIIAFSDEDFDPDQDERRDLLYRDSRRAIEHARKRHLQRRQQPALPDEDVVVSMGEERETDWPGSVKEPVFEPDDFIEEESPRSGPDHDENDDALLSEGIRTPTPRSRRLRRFRDEQRLPKSVSATKIEPDTDGVQAELPSSAAPDRGRFDSIPEISADIELPLLRRSSSATDEQKFDLPAASAEDGSFDRALKRAHSLNIAARIERNHEHRRAGAPAPLREPYAAEPMPNLPGEWPHDTHDQVMDDARATLGTSRILHPGTARERQEGPDERVDLRPVAPIAPRSRTPRPADQAPEARASWWRGTRPPEPATAIAADVMTSAELPATMEEKSDLMPAGAPVAHVAYSATPARPRTTEAVAFDLDDDEGMDSFRNQLFASQGMPAEPVQEQARAPIGVSRRQSRPIGVAPRSRREDPRRREEIVQRPQPAPPRETMEQPVETAQRLATGRPARQERPEPAPRRQPAPSIQPEMLLREPEDAWHEPEPEHGFDVRSLIERDTTLLDMTIEIAPKVTKECATCRSYRPSEQEGRGWCTNEWAFTHRQMVNEDGLPCESTIGCWWLPADREVWLDDFGAPTGATPRIDRLIAHLQPERKVMGD